jgi:hypothetical protein
MLLHIGAAILTGVFLALFSTYLEVHEIYGVVLYIVLSYALFEVLLYLMKELRREDVRYLLAILNLREMWQYIRTELRGKR